MPPRAFPHTVIRASAGTGKTFQLSNRFLRLLAADEPCDAILATTFTRKAAGEILARVLLRLAHAADDPAKLCELAEQLQEPSLDRRRCLALLAGLVRRLHRLRVGTLDSFFIQIARSFSLELGLPPGWQITDEMADAALRAEAVRAVLRDQDGGDVARLMHLLTKGEASRSVSEQINLLVEDLYGVYLEAPAEAWESLPRPKPLADGELDRAIEAFACVECRGDKRLPKARDEGVASLRAQDWEGFLGKGLGAKLLDGTREFYSKPIPPDLAAACEPLVAHCRAMLLGQIANQTEATRKLLEHFDAAYQRLKATHRALRFEDVTRKLAGPWMADRLEDVVYRLDGHVAHLLLDEFQDTAPLQWHVLRPLAKRVVDGAARRSFFCVGDVKQAIYGWRGGVAEIFDAIEAELTGLEPEWLNISRRSSQAVIDTVNRVFGDLPSNAVMQKHEAAARHWAERFAEHTTVKAGLPGYCRLVAAPRADDGEEQDAATCRFAAAQVAQLRREAPGCTVGVLVRRNEAVARLIYEIRLLGIDASEEGGNPLTDSPAVQLVLSLLTLADHPGDTAARFHVSYSPLGPAVGLAEDADANAACRLAHEVRRRLIDDGYGPTIESWVAALAPHCDQRGASRLVQLVELAYGYESRATLRPGDFVRLVNRKKVEDPRSADVRVMTIHQAKGLEFDIVLLPELDVQLAGQPPQIVVGRDGPAGPVQHVLRYVSKDLRPLLPGRFQRMFDEHERRVIEESLCLLYVALTRAVRALHLIVAPSAENERSLRGTMAGLLRAALTEGKPLEPGSTPYEHGDPKWYRSSPRPPADEGRTPSPRPLAGEGRTSSSPRPLAEEGGTSSSPRPLAGEGPGVRDVSPAPLLVRLAPSPESPSRGLDRRSPSGLEGGSLVHLAGWLRLDTSGTLDRGTLVHAWMEEIEWLDDGPPTDEALDRVAKRLLLHNLDVARVMAEFRAMLQRPAIHNVLSRATYEKRHRGGRWIAYRERPFAVRDGDALLSGKIDRLVVCEDRGRPAAAEVLDFKTDTLPRNNQGALAARAKFYRPQLEAYRRAAAKLLELPADCIATRLVFVELGEVVEV